MKTAILCGATGFIGSHLLENLLDSPEYHRVIIVTRKPIDKKHSKLQTLIGDFNSLLSLKPDLVGDEIFLTLGTTKKKTPDPKEYYQIDHDFPVLAARLAKENGAKSVFIVTAVGANSDSSLFYVKMKGDIERDIKSLDFEHTHIFQPSMILGNRSETRPMEKIIIKAWPIFDSLLAGPIDHYKGIDGKEIATAMIESAKIQTEKVKIYRWREMKNLISPGSR